MMDSVALVIGYTIMACAGVASTLFAVMLVVHYLWQDLKEIHTFAWVLKAIEHYRKVQPPPYDKETL